MYFIERFLLGESPALEGILTTYTGDVPGAPIKLNSVYINFDSSYAVAEEEMPSVGLEFNSILDASGDPLAGFQVQDESAEILLCTLKTTINKGTETGATLISRISDMTQLVDLVVRQAKTNNYSDELNLANVRRISTTNISEGEDPVAKIDFSIAYYFTRVL